MMGNIEDIALDAGLFRSVWEMLTDTTSKYVSTHSWIYTTILYNNKYEILSSLLHGQLESKRGNDKSIIQCTFKQKEI